MHGGTDSSPLRSTDTTGEYGHHGRVMAVRKVALICADMWQTTDLERRVHCESRFRKAFREAEGILDVQQVSCVLTSFE